MASDAVLEAVVLSELAHTGAPHPVRAAPGPQSGPRFAPQESVGRYKKSPGASKAGWGTTALATWTLVSVALAGAAACLSFTSQTLAAVATWRWLTLASAAVGLQPALEVASWGVTLALESAWGDAGGALYFVVGTRRPLKHAAYAGGLVLAFQLATTHADEATPWGLFTQRCLYCLFLSRLGALVTGVAAKAGASAFYRRAFVRRLRGALDREVAVGRVLSGAPRCLPGAPHDRLADVHRWQRYLRRVPALRYVERDADPSDDVPDASEVDAMTAALAARLRVAGDGFDAGPLAPLLAAPVATVTRATLRAAVEAMLRDRDALVRTLADAKGIVGSLRAYFGSACQVLLGLAYLVIFRVDVAKAWIMVSSVVVALSVVYGVSARSLYDATVFLVCVHPFDVGDIVVVQSQTYEVCNMDLLTTLLTTTDGSRVWYPNSQLTSQPITNLSRSDRKWESFDLSLDVGTPLDAFDTIQRETRAFLAERPDQFTGECSCQIVAGGDPLKIRISLSLQYAFNAGEQVKLAAARHAAFGFVSSQLHALCNAYPTMRYTFGDAGRVVCC